MNIRELRKSLVEKKDQAQAINDKAKAESRNLSDDEQKQFDTLIAEAKDIQDKINTVAESRERQDTVDKLVPDVTNPEVRVSVDDSNEYRKAFVRYLKSGNLREIETRYGNNTLTSGDGGALVPEDMADKIVKAATSQHGIASIARQDKTAGNSKIVIVRSTYPTAAYVGETGSNVDASYAFQNSTVGWTEVEIALHKAGVKIPVSKEMFEDSYFNVDAEITESGAEGLADLIGGWLVTGTGTRQPYGVVTGSAKGRDSESNDTVTTADLRALKNSVVNKYRIPGKFVMNDSTLAFCQGLYEWVSGPPIVQERPDGTYTMLGKPVVIDESMADIGNGTKPVLFGDFSNYDVVTKVNSLSILVNPYDEASNGIVNYYMSMRVGGKILLSEAIKHLLIS